MASTSPEAPSQSKRRKYDDVRSLISPGTFAVIAGSAFSIGVAGALVISLRRGRARDAAEAAEVASSAALGGSASQVPAAIAPRSGITALQAHPPPPSPPPMPSEQTAAPSDPLSKAADVGPLSLFLSMNKVAFSRKGSRGAPQTSLFDATSDAPPPSALMKSSRRRATPASAGGAEHGVGAMLRARREQERRGGGGQVPKEDQGNPVLLTIKAFGMATAIVGATALVMLEVGRRLLGVRDVDDFTTLMARAFPKGSNASLLAERLGARRRASSSAQDQQEEQPRTDALSERQKDVRSALEKVEDWIRLVGEEIEAENEREEMERQKAPEEKTIKV